MVDDLDELRRVVAGTVLENMTFQATAIPNTGWLGFEAEVPTADRYAVWRTARSLLDKTGRWPVLVYEGGENAYYRDRYTHGEGEQAWPPAIIARGDAMTMDSALATRVRGQHDAYYHREWDWLVRRELPEVQHRIGDAAPSAAEILARVSPPDVEGLDRFLFDWEERVRPTTAREPWPEFEPWSEDLSVVLLLPTSRSYHAPAFCHYLICERGWQRGHDALIAAMRSWKKRFGAELVISGTTLLEFDVARPPTDVEQAYALAAELSLFGLPDGTIRRHARDLIDRPQWCLQERF